MVELWFSLHQFLVVANHLLGIPIGTNFTPLVVALFLFCYEKVFMTFLSDDYQAYLIEAFN